MVSECSSLFCRREKAVREKAAGETASPGSLRVSVRPNGPAGDHRTGISRRLGVEIIRVLMNDDGTA